MKLSHALLNSLRVQNVQALQPPFEVVGNGYGTSNVPEGARGTVVNITDTSYTVKWESTSLEETFSIFGGMAMSLELTQE